MATSGSKSNPAMFPGIGFGAGGAPSRPGGVEGGGVHGDDRVSGLEQAVDDQPTGTFDDDGQFGRGAVAGQPGQSSLKVVFAVLEGPMVDHNAAVVNDGHVMAGAGPVPSDEHQSQPFCRSWRLTPQVTRPSCRFLIVRPSVGHVLDAGLGPRRVRGGNSNWPSSAARQRGRPPTPTEGVTTHGLGRTINTSPMRQRTISRRVLPSLIRRS